MAENIDNVIESICAIVGQPGMAAKYKAAIEAQANASGGKHTPLAIAQATLVDVQSKFEGPSAPAALPSPAPAPAPAAIAVPAVPAPAALPPAPAQDDDMPGDDDDLTQQSFSEWMSGVQSKIISPRKVFEGKIVLRLTGEAPRTVRTNFNENVRARDEKTGKMVDVYEKNLDGSIKMDGNTPVHLVRKKVQVLVPCIGKDGIMYRIAQNMGFKKAIGDFFRSHPVDGVQSYWKIASLTQKAGEADVMVIEKVA